MAVRIKGPQKWAVLIGINDYPFVPKLRGGINDCKLIERILRSNFGFPPGSIRLLLDSQATRAGIGAALDDLRNNVRDDDTVVLFYSGHGTQLPLPSGKKTKDLVGALAPYDLDGKSMATHAIPYNELYDWVQSLANSAGHTVLIIDTDHSGALNPGPDTQGTKQYVLLAACRSSEVSYEYHTEGIFHGAFTYALGQALLEAKPGETYRDVFLRAQTRVTALFPNQHPQLEGASDRPLFGMAKPPAARARSARRTRNGEAALRFVTVLRREGGNVLLGAGAVHGLTAGSQWVIFPKGTLHVKEDTARLGLIEITEVRAVESRARVISEAGERAIVARTQALEQMHNYGEMRLALHIGWPELATGALEKAAQFSEKALVQLVEKTELLRMAHPDEFAPVTAWILLPRHSIAPDIDPVPELGTLTRMTWAVTDELDNLVLPALPADATGSAWDLRDGLERLARYRNVLQLRNPNLNSPLLDKVDFVLMRRSPGGEWIAAGPSPETGVPLFAEGERLAFKITNHYLDPVFVTVLDFGQSGRLSQIHPLAGASERLAPEETILVGARDEDPFVVSLPPDWPFAPKAGDDAGSRAQETLKLFATTYETDFTSLFLQDGLRGVTTRQRGQDTVLWQLLDLALTGYGVREVRPVNLPPGQEWTTVERSFVIERQHEGR